MTNFTIATNKSKQNLRGECKKRKLTSFVVPLETFLPKISPSSSPSEMIASYQMLKLLSQHRV